MRPTILTLALLATATTFAQTASTPPTNNTQIIQLGAPAGNCPVGLFAQRQSSGQTIWTISAEDARIPAKEKSARTANSGVNVVISAGNTTSIITQAELAVTYLPPGPRTVPIATGNAPTNRPAKKNFTLTSEAGTLKLTGNLLVGPVFNITHVSLLSLNYADGTTWHAPNPTACTVEPSGFMLVTAH